MIVTIAIVVLSALFFMRGKVRSDLVALCALLALLLSGILTPSEALAGFSNPVVIMMICLFIVGAGIFRTGLAKMVGARIVKLAGNSDDLLFLLVMLVTAFIGTFISNTGTVAMMMPIVTSMVAGTGKNVRRYLMPMAFASAMGLFTLISTPPNLVIQDAIINAGFKPLSFFSFAPIGAVVVAVGIGILFFLSRLLCRDGKGKRHIETAINADNYGIAEIFIIPNSTLINHTVDENRLRKTFNIDVLGIKRRDDVKVSEEKGIKLQVGDALLIQGTWDDMAALADRHGDLVLIGQPAKEATKVTLHKKAPLAALIMVTMVIVMILNIVPVVTAALSAAILMVATGCLRNMEEAYSSINWHSIILIGAMLPMATAFEKTGVTQFIANSLLSGMGDIGPYMLLAVIYGSASFMTLFLSNTTTTILFAPIALQAAINMNISPYPLLFSVAVAASMCFASPFSTPPNALVMSAGKYSFKDYVVVGLPLQLVMGVVMVGVLPWIFPF